MWISRHSSPGIVETHPSKPSQVPRIVQLKPRIERMPKFRWGDRGALISKSGLTVFLPLLFSPRLLEVVVVWTVPSRQASSPSAGGSHRHARARKRLAGALPGPASWWSRRGPSIHRTPLFCFSLDRRVGRKQAVGSYKQGGEEEQKEGNFSKRLACGNCLLEWEQTKGGDTGKWNVFGWSCSDLLYKGKEMDGQGDVALLVYYLSVDPFSIAIAISRYHYHYHTYPYLVR